MFETYPAARARHASARLEAYEAAREDAVRSLGVSPALRLADIDRAALGVWRSTWDRRRHGNGAGGWSWDELIASYHRRAALLPLAIWDGSDLCGLALGCASRHRAAGLRHTMTVNYVERRPEPPRVMLRGLVVPLAVAAARNYGLALGATRLRLAYPDPRLLGYYGALGFSVAWKGATPLYCEQEI